MERTTAERREVVFPVETLPALRNALRKEAGPLATIHALQAAGYDAGESLWESFSASVDSDPTELGESHFWTLLGRFFEGRGWGSVRHRAPHPGVGVLESGDWAEAASDAEESQPACSFSSGLLAGLLTRAAGGPVAVLQVACRSRGDESCVFAFGSEATIHDLYGVLLEDVDFDTALGQL